MSCADVCLDHDCGDGSNEFYHEAMVTARKTHRCCECRETIQPGARYQRASGKSDGDVWSCATCAICTEIRKAFVCGSWTFGLLWESIEEGMFPVWETSGPIDCLAKLDTKEARDKCRQRYAEWRKEQR